MFCVKDRSVVEDVVKGKREEDTESNGRESIVTEKCEGEKRTVFEVEAVTLHYTLKVGNIETCNWSRKAHYMKVFEHSLKCRRRGLSNGNVLSDVSYERHSKVPTRQTRGAIETDVVPWLSGVEKVS